MMIMVNMMMFIVNSLSLNPRFDLYDVYDG